MSALVRGLRSDGLPQLVEQVEERELLVPVFVEGHQVYESPNIQEIQKYAKTEIDSMWDEYRRLSMPHTYKVDLSDELYDLKKRLIAAAVGDRV